MTLTEAIKIKSEYVFEDKPQDITAFDKADRLSIEALKRVQDMRISPCTTADEILPGETKD